MVIFNSYVSLPEGMGFVAEIDGKITFTMANLFFLVKMMVEDHIPSPGLSSFFLVKMHFLGIMWYNIQSATISWYNMV